MKITLYLVHHGQTDWNKEKIYQGQTDIPLNDEGRKQSLLLQKQLQSIPFAACFSSDLIRAYETASIILQNLTLKIVKDSRLRERSFGSWEGRPVSEYENTPSNLAIDVEETGSFLNRILSFLKTIQESSLQGNVLVVTHYGVQKALIGHLLYQDAEKDFQLHDQIVKISLTSNGWIVN